jgi:hypothetical protein
MSSASPLSPKASYSATIRMRARGRDDRNDRAVPDGAILRWPCANRYRAGRASCRSSHVRNAPKASEMLHCRKMTRCAKSYIERRELSPESRACAPQTSSKRCRWRAGSWDSKPPSPSASDFPPLTSSSLRRASFGVQLITVNGHLPRRNVACMKHPSEWYLKDKIDNCCQAVVLPWAAACRLQQFPTGPSVGTGAICLRLAERKGASEW